MAREKIKIPFDLMGNMIEYDGYGSGVHEYKEAYEFEDVIKFVEVEQGRSALRICCKRSTGERITLFGKNIDDFIKHALNGRVKGRFAFVKRGSNFGVNVLRYDEMEI